MSDEIFFDGVRYISASEASESAGLSRDYVARLCKEGRLQGKRIGKQWYLSRESLQNFAIAQEYARAKRREELAKTRREEYSGGSGRKAFTDSPALQPVTYGAADTSSRIPSYVHGALATVARVPGSAQAARAVTTFPVHAVSLGKQASIHALPPLGDALHKLLAIVTALLFTVGTYFFVDAQYARITERASTFDTALESTKRQLALAAENPAGVFSNMFVELARSVNRGVDSLVYGIMYPSKLTGFYPERDTVSVRIVPRTVSTGGGVIGKAESSQESSAGSAGSAQTVVSQPVIERVVPARTTDLVQSGGETQRIVSSAGGITEEILAARLNQLDNKLTSQIYAVASVGSANSTQIVNNYNAVGGALRIDELDVIKLKDSTITGGSIAGTSVSATSLTVTGTGTSTFSGGIQATALTASAASSLATTTVTGSLTVSGDTTVNGTLSIPGALTISSSTISLLTNTYATSSFISAVTASTTNLTWVNATGTNSIFTNATTTKFFGTNATITFASSTALTVSGTGYFATASTTNLTISGIQSSLLSTNATGGAQAAAVGNGLTFSSNTLSTSFGTTTANTWTALNVFTGAASTSLFSSYGPAYFGASATSTFTAAGRLGILTASPTYPLEVTGSARFSSTVDAANIVATSTSATSTFAGGLLATRAPSTAHTFSSWSIGTANAAPFDASLVINPASAAGDSNLISASVAGSVKFLVDAEGDIFANNLTSVGSVTLSTTSASSFTVEGNTTLGDAITDVTTINGTLTVAGTTTVASVAGKFGVGTTTPWAKLSVHALNGETNTSLFTIASSTASATTTLFNVSNTGAITAAGAFTSTAAGASTLPYASSTALTVSGTGYFGTASTTNLTISGTPSAILTTNSTGAVQALTVGNGLTFSSNTLSSSFGTTTANTWTALQTFSSGLLSQASSTFTGFTQLANASTTQLTNSGTTWLTSLTSALLGTDNTGKVVATTSIGANLLSGTITNAQLANSSVTVNSAGLLSGGGAVSLGGTLSLNASTSPTVGYVFATSTIASTLPYASSTALTVSGTGYFATASTTNLTISAIPSSVPYTSGTGAISGAALAASSIFVTNGSSVPSWTTTLPAFTLGGAVTGSSQNITGLGSLTAFASSTLGAGGQATGLTIFGGATTTANLIVQGTGTSTFSGGLQTSGALNITSTSASSTFANGINVSAGCVVVNGTCLVSNSQLLSSANTWTALQTFQSGLLSQASSTFTGFTQLSNASTTQLTNSGTTWLTSLSSAILGVDNTGKVVATTSIGANLLSGTIANSQLANSSVTINSAGLLSGGGAVSLGSTLTLNASTSPTVGYVFATSTIASTLPYASSTALTVTGTGYFGTATSTTINGNTINAGTINAFTLGGAVTGSSQNITGLGSLTAFASSTLGAGGQATGLTIFGGATTTANLIVQGAGTSTFSGGIQSTALNITSTSASSTFANGIQLSGGCVSVNGTCLGTGSGTVGSGTSGQFPYYASSGTTLSATSTVYLATSGNVGIGTTTPSAKLEISASSTASMTGDLLYLTNLSSATSTASRLSFRADDIVHNTGTTTAALTSILQQNFNAGKGDLAFSTLQSGTLTEVMRITSAGYLGVGTTTPYRKLSVTDTVSAAQFALAYDTTRMTQFQTDASGDLVIDPSGADVLLSDENLLVCTSGCGTSPSGTGSLLAENKLGVGTTTPAYKLTIETSDSTTNFFQIASTTAQSLLVFTSDGKLGVATSSPWAKFTVGAGGAITTVESTLTDAATITVSWRDGNQQRVTLGGNRTINFTSYVSGQVLRLVVCQDGTGSRTVTWDSAVLWNGDSAPTLTTTANQCDLATFVATNATGTLKVFGAAALAF